MHITLKSTALDEVFVTKLHIPPIEQCIKLICELETIKNSILIVNNESQS